MALQYSANGYPSAVTLRTKRTLLVEGPDDKGVITKLAIALQKSQAIATDNLVIDTAADIPDAPGGNRERVEAMHARVTGSRNFAALVDREFRDFDMHNADDNFPHHVEIPLNLFWTRGHSIENYFSDLERVIACLEEHYPEHLPEGYRHAIETAFPSILQSSASITLALEPTNATTLPADRLARVSSIKELDIWHVLSDGSVDIDDAKFELELTGRRGFTSANATAFLQRLATFTLIMQGKDLSISKWICHGHLADSYLWSALGALLQHKGMEPKYATQIAWGNKEAQRRTAADKWSYECVAGSGDCPSALIGWMCAG